MRPSHSSIVTTLIISIATVGCGATVNSEIASSTTASNPAKTVSIPDPATNSPTKTDTDQTSKSPPTVESTASSAEKPKREPIYDTKASGKELIAQAVQKAKRDHKHVLIEWGGNWCGWCYRLHDVFSKNDLVQPIVSGKFELVLVDCNTNRELLEHYGGADTQFSYPHLTVLDADGQVLTNQRTEPLEEGSGHSPKSVADFLTKWAPAKGHSD